MDQEKTEGNRVKTLRNNFSKKGKKRVLLVTTEDFKEWSGNEGVYQNFKFIELEVLFVNSNKKLIDKLKTGYKARYFHTVVLAPGHGAKEDAQIIWPYKFISYEQLFPCIQACIPVTKHINILTCYQSKPTINYNNVFVLTLEQGCHLNKGIESVDRLQTDSARGVVLSGWRCELISIDNQHTNENAI
jgi:hypothetical protein